MIILLRFFVFKNENAKILLPQYAVSTILLFMEDKLTFLVEEIKKHPQEILWLNLTIANS